MNLALGRTPHDPMRLAALPDIHDHFDPQQPPDRLMRSGIAYQPQMGANTWAPDCTGESLRECATAQAAVLGGYTLSVARNASLEFYSACVGLPFAAAADQIKATDGAEMLAVAQRQMQSGFNTLTGAGSLVGLFGRVPVSDRARLASGSARFGLGWWGIRIYQRDQDTFDSADPWDDDGSNPGALVGGHAIGGAWEYTGLGDRDEVACITWGRAKPATWRWVRARLDVALCLWWRQLDPASRPVNADALEADLRAWSAA